MDAAKLAELAQSFLQGASNAAASAVSAPVDGVSWLMRHAGVPVPSNPLGGSDWMAQQGLTRKPQNELAGLLGESAGGVAPLLAGAYAPKIAGALNAMGSNAAARPNMLLQGQRGGVLSPLEGRSHYAVNDLSSYTPKLYRETSADAAESFMPGSRSYAQPADLYFSNDPATALGQGANKGVVLEFDAKGMRGQLNMRKPGAQQAYDAGAAEFITRDAVPGDIAGNLASITVKPGQAGPFLRRLETTAKAAGWMRSTAPDGSIVFGRPQGK